MRRTLFTDSWEFARDDDAFAPVVLPHDAMLGNKRAANAPAGSASGYYFGARYRYRRTFEIDAATAAGSILLEFEGVYRDARIAVNGIDVADVPPYGFVPFFVDLAELVHAGENVIEVEADNSEQPDCRWYSGGGIHRPVWLWTGDEAHIAPEDIRVTTLSLDPAIVRVEVEATAGEPIVSIVDEDGKVVAQGKGSTLELEVPQARLWSAEHPALYRCRVELVEPSSASSNGAAAPTSGARVVGGIIVGIVSEQAATTVVDSAEIFFGIRMLEWSPRGLFVNGHETLLRGGCIHCDNGVIGAASFADSEWRRISLLKEAGFNAVRIAHNPAPSALLDACDHLGMYVMDEAWDMWFMRKNAFDYAGHFLDWCDHDLRRLATHDYNHPSVIMYSIGNEIADPITPEGVAVEQSLVALLHVLDPTRPVTCGFNLTMMVMERMGKGWYAQSDDETGTSLVNDDDQQPRASLLFNLTAQALGSSMTHLANAPGADALVSPALDALDIAGYNYADARYSVDARKHPDRIIVGSETFPHKLEQNWSLVTSIPNVIGDFMWAAWDYLGEAGAGAWAYTPEEAGFSKPWPWLIAGSGAIDILGHPNAAAALAGAVWRTAKGPSINVRPVNIMNGKTYKATWRGTDAIGSWSWRGCEGTAAEVEVYDGRAHAIRLELDGNVVGKARVRGCLARFKLPYRPGVLRAISLDERGNAIGSSKLASATGPLRLRLGLEAFPRALPESNTGQLAYVTVDIVGENGEVESNADELVTLAVDGADLIGFGSARPATTEQFQTGAYTTYRGRALAVIHRSTPGLATVAATAPSLPPASVTIEFHPAQ